MLKVYHATRQVCTPQMMWWSLILNLKMESWVMEAGAILLIKSSVLINPRLSVQKEKLFFFFESSIIKVETPEGIQEYDTPYPPHVQQPLLQTIVQELRGEGKCPSTGETGARANLILDWITAVQKH